MEFHIERDESISVSIGEVMLVFLPSSVNNVTNSSVTTEELYSDGADVDL